MFCAVEGCSNHKSKSRYFLFPKDVQLCQKWVQFCRRPDNINTKLEKICVEHFLDSDFERDLPYELGVYSKPRPLKLKPDSVPSVQNNEEDFDFEFHVELETGNEETHETAQHAKSVAQRKQIVDAILTEYDKKQDEEEAQVDNGTETSDQDEEETEEIVQVVVDADAYLTALEKENIQLRRENFKMNLATQKDAVENEKLRQQLEMANARYRRLYGQLEKVFSRSQIHKLHSGKRIVWPKQDLQDAFTLYASSPTVYDMLLQKGYPLPSKRMLQELDESDRVLTVENISNATLDSFELENGSELIEIVDITHLDHNYVN